MLSHFFQKRIKRIKERHIEVSKCTFLDIFQFFGKEFVTIQDLCKSKQKVGTGVSARGTFNASIVPHRKPCSTSQPWILTLTFHASSF
jgi:hypothetical protein